MMQPRVGAEFEVSQSWQEMVSPIRGRVVHSVVLPSDGTMLVLLDCSPEATYSQDGYWITAIQSPGDPCPSVAYSVPKSFGNVSDRISALKGAVSDDVERMGAA